MEKMTAITFAKTGHLLGVVTRASQPDIPATVAQVAAGGFRLRVSDGNSSDTLDIPENELGIALLDYDTRILYRPHLFFMEDGNPEQPFNNTPPTVSLSGANITATLPAKVHETVVVWCCVVGGSLNEPFVCSVTIRGTPTSETNTATESQTLATGDYLVAIFAKNYPLSVVPVSI